MGLTGDIKGNIDAIAACMGKLHILRQKERRHVHFLPIGLRSGKRRSRTAMVVIVVGFADIGVGTTGHLDGVGRVSLSHTIELIARQSGYIITLTVLYTVRGDLCHRTGFTIYYRTLIINAIGDIACREPKHRLSAAVLSPLEITQRRGTCTR